MIFYLYSTAVMISPLSMQSLFNGVKDIYQSSIEINENLKKNKNIISFNKNRYKLDHAIEKIRTFINEFPSVSYRSELVILEQLATKVSNDFAKGPITITQLGVLITHILTLLDEIMPSLNYNSYYVNIHNRIVKEGQNIIKRSYN